MNILRIDDGYEANEDIFFLRHSEYLRNYESVVRLLAERGHTVHLGFYKIGEDYKEGEIKKLQQDNTKITYAVYSWRDRQRTPRDGVCCEK